MKWSRYYVTVKKEELIFLFHYLNGTGLLLNSNLYRFVLSLDSLDDLCEMHPSLYRELVCRGFLLEDDIDEVSKCVSILEERRTRRDLLKVTINPTLDCNLRCWYCYEEHGRGTMLSQDVLCNLFSYFKRKVLDDDLRYLEVSFFGGEPLLGFNRVVRPIVEKVLQLCGDYNKVVSFAFTTNAVLLDSSKVDYLAALCVPVFLQVPFDGGRRCHNETKKDSKGHGVYDEVLKNVIYSVQQGLRVTVRCNFTLSNIDSFRELLDDLQPYACENLVLNFQKVWQEMETEELMQKEQLVKEYAVKLGLLKKTSGKVYMVGANMCYADYLENVVINYNGDVFQCTAREFREGNRVGVLIKDGNIQYNERMKKRVDSYIMDVCKSCRLLPVCAICSQRRLEAGPECPVSINAAKAELELQGYAEEFLLSRGLEDVSAEG